MFECPPIDNPEDPEQGLDLVDALKQVSARVARLADLLSRAVKLRRAMTFELPKELVKDVPHRVADAMQVSARRPGRPAVLSTL